MNPIPMNHERDAERLTVGCRDAAKMLGISERLLWTWTNTGKIPHMRMGTRVLYPVEQLRKWVEGQCRADA